MTMSAERKTVTRDKHIIFVFAVAFASIVFSVFGTLWVAGILVSKYDVRYVPSDSMWPSIPRGSVVVIEKNPFFFEVGDVLVYHYPLSPDTKLMHRLIRYEPEGIAYLRGDNATGTDRVPYTAIDGRVIIAFPYAGFLRALFGEDPLVFAVTVMDLVVLLVLSSFVTESEEES